MSKQKDDSRDEGDGWHAAGRKRSNGSRRGQRPPRRQQRSGRGRNGDNGSNGSVGESNAGPGRGAGRRNRGRQQSPKPTVVPPNARPAIEDIAKNGDKGAKSSTVAEASRIRFATQLREFRELSHEDDQDAVIEFPSTLTNTERKFIHEIASQMGLVSKSTGKGENRRIQVKKKSTDALRRKASQNQEFDLQKIPVLRLGQTANKALRKHLQDFKMTKNERMQAFQTTSSSLQSNSADPESLQAALGEMDIHADIVTSQRSSRRRQQNRVSVKAETRHKFHWEAQQRKQHKQFKNAYQHIMAQRRKLPTFPRQQHIVEEVQNNFVTIISGDTGCGKSTQVPQFILDATPDANLVVTQPRRISAISIAERIAEEQCQPIQGGLIGYQVRLDSNVTAKTQLTFLTPGVLLRKLTSSPMLEEYTHVIIDEIHERDKYTEFLMIALRDLVAKRSSMPGKELRLILMSATLQADTFVQYFTTSTQTPSVVELQGRTFPVQTFFLETVLEMTGYIDPTTAFDSKMEVVSAQELDQELEKLITGASATSSTGNRKKDNGKDRQPDGNETAQKFCCNMCGSSDFVDLTEFAAHVAFCDAIRPFETANASTPSLQMSSDGVDVELKDGDDSDGGDYDGYDEYDLDEQPVYNAASEGWFLSGNEKSEVLNEVGAGGDLAPMPPDDAVFLPVRNESNIGQLSSSASDEEHEEESSGDDSVVVNTENLMDDTKQDNGKSKAMQKWNGQSPFTVVTADQHKHDGITETQERLLSQYQVLHDDDTIDNELLIRVLEYINKSSYGDGAILVFFASWQEISTFQMLLQSRSPFSNASKYLILPLHSGISGRDQRKVLRRPPPGVRKVILSTNIAETSLTIEDVAFVIDTGRAKEKSYDPHLKTATLQSVWISQASAKQRRGRAGRTKPGVCFHLFSSRRHDSLRPFTESELMRTPLEEMCLMCKRLGIAPGDEDDDDGVPAFLAKALTPPHPKAIKNALDMLISLGAMKPVTNALTHLGFCLSTLSLEPRVGKMVLLSYLLGCSHVAADMAVSMSYKSLFNLAPPHLRKQSDEKKLGLSRGSESDQITAHYILKQVDGLRQRNSGNIQEFCRRHFVAPETLNMISSIRRNLCNELASIRFAPPQVDAGRGSNTSFHNRNAADPAIWQATLAAGLYPNIATRRRGEVNFSTRTNQKVKMHPSSINALKGQPLKEKCNVPDDDIEIICFGELIQGNRIYTANQTTHVASSLPILLLCGDQLTVQPIVDDDDGKEEDGKRPRSTMSVLCVDDWLDVRCESEIAAGIVMVRKRIASAFPKMLLNPSSGFSSLDAKERAAVGLLKVLLQSAYRTSLKSTR